MMTKRRACFIISFLMIITMLSGCGTQSSSGSNQNVQSTQQSAEATTGSKEQAYATTEKQEVSTSELTTESVPGNPDIIQATQEVFAMDTYMSVTAYGKEAKEAVTEAISEIQRFDRLWSVGNPDSEIAKINISGGSEQLSDETAALIEGSVELYKETDGLFDITIYPLMDAWGFTTGDFKVPSQDQIDELLKYVDAGAIDFDRSTKILTLPAHVQIDLGGIAKGYTSAYIMDIFEKYDVNGGLVSLGGNVQAYRKKVDGSNWRVGVENPDNTVGQLFQSNYVGVLEIADKAVITSGGYERNFEEDGKTYHHILDPGTGYPAENGLISVTIVSDDGLLADGLSTALFIMGQDEALDFWREHKEEFDAILVNDQGEITVTEGLKDSFSSGLKFDIVK